MKIRKSARIISLVLSMLLLLTTMPVITALAAAEWTGEIPSKEEAGATFRLGVVSDSHIGVGQTTAGNLDTALSIFENLGDVDAVAMNGDMTYAPVEGDVTSGNYIYNEAAVGLPAELYGAFKGFVEASEFTLAGTQEDDVFTTDTAQGKPVIYSMGNHEFPLNGRSETIVGASKQLFTEQTGRTPNHIMNVGGYTFIVGAPADYDLSYLDAEEFAKAQILAAEQADPSNRPIFYLQHEAVHGTVTESLSSASDNSDSFKAFLNEHPRVIVFSGHTHAIIEDPKNIWQDGFTAIATSQLGGGSVSGGSASYSMGTANTGSQALMIDLTENKEGDTVTSTDVFVYRMNLLTGKLIGEPYTFSIDGTTDTFRYNVDRYENPSIAAANTDAELTIDNGDVRQGFKFTYHTDDFTITPGEAWLQDDFVLSYRVVVENVDAGVRTQNFKVFSDIFEPESSQLDSYSITLSKQLDRGTKYKISVYALTPFTADLSVAELAEKGVTPVSYEFTTSDELTAADLALLRTHEDVNVALNKPIIAGNPNQTGAAKLVDGTLTGTSYIDGLTSNYPASGTMVTLPSGAATIAAATSNADDWFIIDLGRRYDISEVKVWPKSNPSSEVNMQNFTIDASNVEDFSESVPLGGVKTEGVTAAYTPIVINGDGGSYRYIRLRKTAGTYHVFGEIEVFADVKAQEVSRNRTVAANYYTPSSYTPAKAVDGKLADPCWLVSQVGKSDDPGYPYNLVVDLEQDYPIGVIEMFGRYTSNADVYRQNWKIYGFTDAQGKPTVDQDDYSDGALLWHVGSNEYPESGLKAVINGNGKYRYIVFSKVANQPLAVGEIRAEVVLPQITQVSRKSETEISVSFTEKMDIASLSADGAITLKTTGGETLTPEVTLTDASEWDGGYDATLTFAENLPTSGMTLTIDGSVKDINGISFVQDVTENISGKTLAINKSYSSKKENVNVALNKTVIAGNPNRTDAAKLVDGSAATIIAPESYTGNDGLSIALPDGNVASAATGNGNDWFIVDLGRRYEVSSVVLHPRTSGQADAYMWGFVIEGANTPGFTDKVKLGEVKNNDSTVDGTTALTFPGDGGVYRYIRLRKTVGTYHVYGDLEVFADMTVTNVARGKSAEVGVTSSSYNIKGVTDGQIKNANGWFQSGAPGADKTPNNLVIDLADEYPLEMVRLAGRYGNGTASSSAAEGLQDITAYGYSAAAGKPAPLYGAAPQNPTAVLFSTGSAPGKWPVTYYFVGGHYRYLALSKTKNAANTFVSEVEAYVVNPAAYSVDINDNGTLTVHFSDKMEASTLTPENFTINGVTLSNPVVTSGYNGGYDVTFSYSGEIISGMELVVDETVRNQNGIEMAADAVLPLPVDVFTVTRNGVAVESLLAGSSHVVTAKFIAEENATAVMFAAIKQADGTLVSCAVSEDTQMTTGNAASFTIEGLVPKSGEKLYVYIWEKSTLRPLLDNLEVQ